jgi:hypothetical protein
MFKSFFTATIVITMALLLRPAYANQDNDTEATVNSAKATANEISVEGEETDGKQVSVMDLPVNFSTPEDVEKSLQLIKEESGERSSTAVKNAMKHILYYDLGLGHDKEKMYKKLNGKTPNEIIAMMRR